MRSLPPQTPVTPLRRFAGPMSLALLAFAVSASGLANGFAFDDVAVIERNEQVHSLGAPEMFFVVGYWPREYGGALYRPLASLWFALQWALGDGAPAVFHGVSVALYIVVTLAVWGVARALVGGPFAWVAGALFAVHPVHVEAVANVVGQSELIVALCFGCATGLYLRARRRAELRAWESLSLFGLTIVAALTKEHGLLLPALLGAAEITVVRDPRPWRSRLRSLLPTALLLAVGGGLVVAARYAALGTLVGEYPALPLRNLGAGHRLLTMLGIVPEWYRLLLWPAHLQHEYGPPALDVARGLAPKQALGMMLLAGTIALAWRLRRSRPAVMFGVLWVGVTVFPVSNLVVASGVLLAERTLFAASIGVVVILATLGDAAWPRLAGVSRVRPALMVAFGVVLALAAARSAARQVVWRDNRTLFTQGLRDAPDTYQIWYAYGAYLLEVGQLDEARRALERAAGLYGNNPGVFDALGLVRYRQSGCGEAIPHFARALALEPRHLSARGRLYHCLLTVGDTARAHAVAIEGAKLGQAYFQLVTLRSSLSAVPLPARP